MELIKHKDGTFSLKADPVQLGHVLTAYQDAEYAKVPTATTQEEKQYHDAQYMGAAKLLIKLLELS